MGARSVLPNPGLDFCPGRCQDTGCFLPATHSCFWESREAAALGKPDLISKHEGKRTTQPSQIWNHLERDVSDTSSSLSSLFPGLGLWVPERAKEFVLPAGAAVSRPPSAAWGASAQGKSSHMQLTAVVAPGLRRLPPGFLFDSDPPLGWLLLRCHQGSKLPAVSSEKGRRRRVGKGEEHLLPPHPSSCNIYFKVTGGAFLSL